MAEILGGVLAWLILGSLVSPIVMAAIMAAVAGIMVALSVDELMPLAKEIDPNNNPSYGVLCGMSVMGMSLVMLQTAGIGEEFMPPSSTEALYYSKKQSYIFHL